MSATDMRDGGLDFAAMLAQNAERPAASTPTSSTANGDEPAGSNSLDTDSGALLRPWQGLTTAEESTGKGADGIDGADVAGLASAADGSTATSAVDADPADAAGAAAAEATTGLTGASTANELASAAQNLAVDAARGSSSGAHRAEARDAGNADGLSSVGATGPGATDAASVTGASGPNAAHTSGEQAAGEGSLTEQQQPEFGGTAAAAGVQHNATGADSVSETPIPAHTVAPTIAQVAQSLRTSGDGTSRLVIRLDPVQLGPVLVSLRTRGGVVDISVRADNAGGAAAVADQRAHIEQVLAEHGLDLSSFHVSSGEASGGAGSSTSDADTSDGSADGAPHREPGTDPGATNYADVQAQASGADGQANERRAFVTEHDNGNPFRTTDPTSSTDAKPNPVRTVRREGTWL
jgi:flagellar hook-length control protein FliK